MIELILNLPPDVEFISLSYSRHFDRWTVLLRGYARITDEYNSVVYERLGSGVGESLARACELALVKLAKEITQARLDREAALASRRPIISTVTIGDTQIDLDL